MKSLITFAIGALSASVCTYALAWPWGPKSFEECISGEMKGRPTSQQEIVRESCRKQFPALPDFKSPTKIGALNCYSSALSVPITLKIEKTTISANKLAFNIISRNSELARAASSKALIPDWKEGTTIVINFDEGVGILHDTRNFRNQFDISCKQ